MTSYRNGPPSIDKDAADGGDDDWEDDDWEDDDWEDDDWEDDDDPIDARLRIALEAHRPPITLTASVHEEGATGVLLAAPELGQWRDRIYLDRASGVVYAVPTTVEDVEEMSELVATRSPRLRTWPHSQSTSNTHERARS